MEDRTSMLVFSEKNKPSFRRLEKIRNTFLQAHWLWPWVVKSKYYDKWLRQDEQNLTLFAKVLRRIDWSLRRIWFWPNLHDAVPWSEQEIGTGWSPRNYVELLPSSLVLVDEVEARTSGPEASILDLGCNCGRHLNALVERGFTNLFGVDIGRAALDHMDVAFPILKSHASVNHMSFQEFLSIADTNAYEIIFSHGATVELVHPSFPLVKEMARVAKEYVILVIQENGHSYPRFWTYEFQRVGFVLVKFVCPCAQNDKREFEQSLMVFRKIH